MNVERALKEGSTFEDVTSHLAKIILKIAI